VLTAEKISCILRHLPMLTAGKISCILRHLPMLPAEKWVLLWYCKSPTHADCAEKISCILRHLPMLTVPRRFRVF
jgi:hypothetical protein